MSAALDRLRRLGEPFMEDVSRAQWMVGAGHAREADLRGIYAKHAAGAAHLGTVRLTATSESDPAKKATTVCAVAG